MKVYSIGLLMHAEQEQMRQIAMGAADFQREYSEVNIVGLGYKPLLPWSYLNEFSGDGLIAVADSFEHIKLLKNSKVPFVLAGSRFLDSEFPVVATNSFAIGRQAADYLLSCGLMNLLFVGSNKWDDERLRYQGFETTARQRGADCLHADISFAECAESDLVVHYNDTNIDRVVEELVSQAKPIGVFCPNAMIGRLVIEACRSAGISVPDEVAVLAVNDDPLLCKTTDPALSTIVQSSREIGFQAAKMLFEMLTSASSTNEDQTETAPDDQPAAQKFLPPRRIAVRRSTDMLVFGDPTIEAALRFMRDHAHTLIGIAEIVRHVDVSRRTLELKFRDALQKTPLQELLRMRLEIAKSLLVDSQIPITEIALRSGFASSQVFSSVFKKNTQQTPSQYRQNAKGLG